MKKHQPVPPAEPPSKSARRHAGSDAEELFSAIYGNESNFSLSKIESLTPRVSHYYEAPTRPIRSKNIAPVQINLKGTNVGSGISGKMRSMFDLHNASAFFGQYDKAQCQIPKLLIPKIQKSVPQNPGKQMPLGPLKEPSIGNENLSNFDEPEFDPPGFIEKIYEKLKEGPIPGYSLFLDNSGDSIWKECEILSYDGLKFGITWPNGKQKQVYRIGLRFAFEDSERFEHRRKAALLNRQKAVEAIKQEAYILSRIQKERIIPNMGIVDSMLKKLSEPIRNHSLSTSLIQEIVQLQSIAHVTESLISEGKLLNQVFIHSRNNNIGRIKKKRIDMINLPNPIYMMKIIECLEYYQDQEIIDIVYKTNRDPIDLSIFLDKLYLQFLLINSNSRSSMSSLLYDYALKLSEGHEKDTVDKFLKMTNLRVVDWCMFPIITFIRKFQENLYNYNTKFLLCFSKDTMSFNWTARDMISQVREYLLKIVEIYSTLPMPEVSLSKETIKNLSIKYSGIDSLLNSTIDIWGKMVEDSFSELMDYMCKMKGLVKFIPDDPHLFLCSIMPSDFSDVIFNRTVPSVPFSSINLKLVRENLIKAEESLCAFKYAHRDYIGIGIFTIHFVPYLTKVENHVNELFNETFQYLQSHSDYQINTIGGLVDGLLEKTSRKPSTVEEWFEKHCLLSHLRSNVIEINDNMNDIGKILGFMAEFLYEPQKGIQSVYLIRKGLHSIIDSIEIFTQNDKYEKEVFISNHNNDKKAFIYFLSGFFDSIRLFFHRDLNNDTTTNYHELLVYHDRFMQIIQDEIIYRKRDHSLSIEETHYPKIAEIGRDLSLLLSIWEKANSFANNSQKWLSTLFKELNVSNISQTMLESEAFFKNAITELRNNENGGSKIDKTNEINPINLISSIEVLLNQINHLILHLPIIKHLCNPYLRSRHWKQISDVSGLSISPNDGLTWNWLMEGDVEKHLLAISSISRSADMEFKIEKALAQMIEELQALKINPGFRNGELSLQSPSDALLLLSEHQSKMQDIFVPPYVQPFISKIKDYESLAANLRTVLKQALETEQSINDLIPAMESMDIKSNHGSMAESFDKNVEDFSSFASSLKVTANYHQIVSDQSYVGMSQHFADKVSVLKGRLGDVLEEKRQKFPRFRLLSDNQLVLVLANSQTPSRIKDIFSFLYPEIKEATFIGEEACTGFISQMGFIFTFDESVMVKHDRIETWFIEFDKQIKHTIRNRCHTLLSSPIVNLEKTILGNHVQIVSLVLEILFTSNIIRCFNAFDSNFTERRSAILKEQLVNLEESIKTTLKTLICVHNKNPGYSMINAILLLLNHFRIVRQIIENNVESPYSPVWLSRLKYYQKTDINGDFAIEVRIGPSVFDYSFDFIEKNASVIYSEAIYKVFCSISMIVSGHGIPLIYSYPSNDKSSAIIQFCNSIGKQPIVFQCTRHISSDTVMKVLSISHEINESILLNNIYELKDEILLSHLIRFYNNRKARNSNFVFASYTVTSSNDSIIIPELLKISLRPVFYYKNDFFNPLLDLLSLMQIQEPEHITKKLVNLVTLVSNSLIPPLDQSITKEDIFSLVFDGAKSIDNFPEFLFTSLMYKVKKEYSSLDLSTLIGLLCSVFDKNPDNNELLPNYKDENFDSKTNELQSIMQSCKGIIICGEPLSGKSSLILNCSKQMNVEVEFINPLSFSLDSLFGDGSPGYLLNLYERSNNKWIVFDGSCTTDWMDSVVSILKGNLSVLSSDLVFYQNKSKTKLIFETPDLGYATPSVVAMCSTLYIGPSMLSIANRGRYFLAKIKNDSRLIEPLSNTIVSSQISSKILLDLLELFMNTFFPPLYDEIAHNSLFSNCMNNFFSLCESLILNYFVPQISSQNHQHSVDELLVDLPKLSYFALYWSFASSFESEKRLKVAHVIENVLNVSQFKNMISLNDNIANLYFDSETHSWVKWPKLLHDESFFSDKSRSPYSSLIDFSPHFLVSSLYAILPLMVLSKELLIQGNSCLIHNPSSQQNQVVIDEISHIQFILSNFAPQSYIFPINGTHKDLRSMILNTLPDSHVSSGVSIRIPLLSLSNFGVSPDNSSTELVRFIIEHSYIPNDETFSKERSSGLVFLIETRNSINSRLSGHMFSLVSPCHTKETLVMSLSQSIEELWHVSDPGNRISLSIYNIYNEIKCYGVFNHYYILKLIQRVSMILNSFNNLRFLDILKYSLIRTFYDSQCNDNIITVIETTLGSLSDEFSIDSKPTKHFIDPYSLSSLYNGGLESRSRSLEDLVIANSNNIQTKLKYPLIAHGSIPICNATQTDFLRTMPQFLQDDIFIIAQSLSIPYTNVLIESSDYNTVIQSLKISSECFGFGYKIYDGTSSMITVFHDLFIESGRSLSHFALVVNVLNLTQKEIKDLALFTVSHCINGLFKKGEVLELMTQLYGDGDSYIDPFQEETMESLSNYNSIISDFLNRCKMFFHWVIVGPSSLLNHATIDNAISISCKYNTFDQFEVFVKSCLSERVSNHFGFQISSAQILQVISSFLDSECIKKMGLTHRYFMLFVKRFVYRYNNSILSLQKHYVIHEDLRKCYGQIETFLNDSLQSMNEMELKLLRIKQEMNDASVAFIELQKKSDEELQRFDKEAQLLREEENKAELLRKDLETQLKLTNSILEDATKELRNLSSRDIAVIKGMNHPPKGVMLVVKGICILLGQGSDIISNDDSLSSYWALGKKIMNDPSFLNTLVTASLESIKPEIIESLKNIVSDPNFEPSVVERSSTAAKSICTFIRSVVPYTEALEIHKIRMKESQLFMNNLDGLKSRQEEAKIQLERCKKESFDVQIRQEVISQNRLKTEEELYQQRLKIEEYKKVESVVFQYFDQCNSEYSKVIAQMKECELLSFLKELYYCLYGLHHSSERDNLVSQIFEVLSLIGVSLKELQSDVKELRTALLIEDESLISKWQRVNYPISSYWKENLSFLSLNHGRWVAALGLKLIPRLYIRKFISKNIVFTSIHSSDFEKDILSSLSGSSCLFIYDFSFKNPHYLINMIYQSTQNDVPMVFKGVTYSIPKQFMIYFDMLSWDEICFCDLDVSFIDLSISSDTISEQLVLHEFEISSSKEFSDAMLLDNKIVLLNQEIEETELRLINRLVSASSMVFTDPKILSEFNNLLREINHKKAKQALQLVPMGSQFNEIVSVRSTVERLTRFFSAFPLRKSLWDCFVHFFEKCSIIPLSEYYNSCINSFLPAIMASIPYYKRCKLYSKFFDPADNLELLKTSSIYYMNPNNFIKSTFPQKPVICVSDKAFSFSSLISFSEFKGRLNMVAPSDVRQEIVPSMQKGSILITLCKNTEQIMEMISSICTVLSSGFVSSEFRFFILYFGDSLELDELPRILSMCDVFYFDNPYSIQSHLSSTFHVIQPKKYSNMVQNLCFFNTLISMFSYLRFRSPISSFENINYILQLIPEMSIESMKYFGDFFTSVFYSSEFSFSLTDVPRLWTIAFNGSLSDYYPLPRSHTDSALYDGIRFFPIIDNPEHFGCQPGSFDLSMITKENQIIESENVASAVQINSIRFVQQKEAYYAILKQSMMKLMDKRSSKLLSSRVNQMLSSGSIDMSLIINPQALFDRIRIEFSAKSLTPIEDVSLLICFNSNQGYSLSSITLLGACVSNNRVQKFNGCSSDISIALVPIKSNLENKQVSYYHLGIRVYNLYTDSEYGTFSVHTTIK